MSQESIIQMCKQVIENGGCEGLVCEFCPLKAGQGDPTHCDVIGSTGRARFLLLGEKGVGKSKSLADLILSAGLAFTEAVTQEVWVAWTNADRTEGRGMEMVLAVCKEKATALRLGKGGGVQGLDCLVSKETALRYKGKWLVPGRIQAPSKEDKRVQERLDRETILVQKAKAAGLTDEDLNLLRGANHDNYS